MSPPCSRSALSPTPDYAYSSLPSQPQSSTTATNPRHLASTAPPQTPVISSLSQSQGSYPYPLSPMMPSTPRASSVPLPPHTPSPYPGPPCSILACHSSSHALSFHPLLCYSQHSRPALVWDIRTDPTPASLFQVPIPTSHDNTRITSADVLVPVSERELYRPATTPPRCVLRLFCGIVPPTSAWDTITVTSSASSQTECVTVLDVLNAVREYMRTQIIQEEWDALRKKQQDRVNETFDSRWRMSVTPVATREAGVLRQDCLLLHTLWGGLTPSFVKRDAAVLTLRRLDR